MSNKFNPEKEFPSSIEKLIWVMQCLRDPDRGCPWDKEQTYETILPYTIEEAYEVADAIENGSIDDFKEELGDLLLQVIYHAQIAVEANDFSFDDVAESIASKMISRHPHVFGEDDAQTANDVVGIWERQKDKEHDYNGALDSVTKGLPALLRARKLQKAAAKVGFEWRDADEAFLKVHEEINEFKEASESVDKEEEFGDLLFALVNVGRMQGIDAEEALRKASNKFTKRFEGIEKQLNHDGKLFSNLSLDQMLEYWQRQK